MWPGRKRNGPATGAVNGADFVIQATLMTCLLLS
jgi:hypothetical protein